MQSNVRFWFLSLFVAWASLSFGRAQVPEWIWHDNQGRSPGEDEMRYFRKVFSLPAGATKAVLTAAGDDRATLYLNGKQVAANRNWNQAVVATVTDALRAGDNVLAIRGQNGSGDAAVIARLEITFGNREKQVVVTDSSWTSFPEQLANWQNLDFAATGWTKTVSRGKLGVQPWGDVMAPKVATAAESLKVLSGFQVELLHSSEPGQGSWICMAVDEKGRLIISPQEDSQPLLRITIADGKVAKIEPVPAPMRQAMGMLYAHRSLYVNGHGPQGTGLYRLVDDNQNDQFESGEVRFLKKFAGEGEHGYHAVVLGPDEKIYVMNGNHTQVPESLSPRSPHRNYAEDILLPRHWDGGGHAVGIMAPGGYIARTDAEGKEWTLLLAGFRNAYDFDFNADGELFAFDSDMEWDWGMPWYRPTRVLHCVSAGDYGWRSGSGKWPEYYADGLPAVANIGLGSPTGVKFGTRSRFPDKYQKAMFLMDWSYGRIVALHLRPKGASYEGDYETFVQGKPLNVSDMEFGADGALYFVTGGRGTQSGLYRVGARPEVSSVSLQSSGTPAESQAAEARSLRRSLEAYHGKIDSAAIDFAWPHLNSDDRWIRYAARTAVEQQELALWKGRALAEQRPSAALAGLMALARVGAREHETQIVESIGRLWKQSLTEAQKLDALRVLAVAFTRARLAELGPNAPGDAVARLVSLAPPAGAIRQAAGQYLSSAYPSSSPVLNRELVQLLVYLEAPEVIDKTLDLAERAATQEDQIHYLFHLRNLRSGWAPAQRRKYFGLLEKSRTFAAHPPELTRWFAEANRPYSDGASFAKNLANLRKDAVAAIPETERSEFANLTAPAVASTAPAAPARNFVRDWKMEEFAAELSAAWRGRSFAKGKQAFADAQCLACHRFGNEGGALGPDLTAIASRFTRRDVLESILEPSKVLSEQFLNTRFFLKNGEDVTGRVLDENDRRVEVLTEPLSQTKTEVRKADIVRREPSKVSPMPAALVNTLTKAEVLDLLAYIESAGNATAAAYK